MATLYRSIRGLREPTSKCVSCVPYFSSIRCGCIDERVRKRTSSSTSPAPPSAQSDPFRPDQRWISLSGQDAKFGRHIVLSGSVISRCTFVHPRKTRRLIIMNISGGRRPLLDGCLASRGPAATSKGGAALRVLTNLQSILSVNSCVCCSSLAAAVLSVDVVTTLSIGRVLHRPAPARCHPTTMAPSSHHPEHLFLRQAWCCIQNIEKRATKSIVNLPVLSLAGYRTLTNVIDNWTWASSGFIGICDLSMHIKKTFLLIVEYHKRPLPGARSNQFQIEVSWNKLILT